MGEGYIFTDALYKETSPEKKIEYVKYKIDSLKLPTVKCPSKIQPVYDKNAVSPEDIRKATDLSALKPDVSSADIERLCRHAVEGGFFAVCVNQVFIQHSKSMLGGSGVRVAGVVSFPLGASDRQTKKSEAARSLKMGADELDVVMNIGLFKSGHYAKVYDEITQIVGISKEKPVKVIIETCLLKDEEKVAASLLVQKAGAAFVKTSTGFSASGAAEADVALIRKMVGNDMGIKASGGIRDYPKARAMIESGANRIGSSGFVKDGMNYI